MKFIEKVAEVEAKMIKYRRYLHKYPEGSSEKFATQQYISEQ